MEHPSVIWWKIRAVPLTTGGRAKVTLFTVFAIAVANLRAADRWRAELAAVRRFNDAIGAAKKSRSRRRAATVEAHLRSGRRRRRRPALAGAP